MIRARHRYLVLIFSGLVLAAILFAVYSKAVVSRDGISAPLHTPTPLPTVNPTLFGGRIVVGTPLPTPELAEAIISPSNVHQLVEFIDLGDPAPSGVSDALFTRDGRRLVAAWSGLTVWQLPGAEKIHTLPITSTSWTPLALSPDGQIAAIGNYENLGWVELWNITTQQRARQHRGGQQVTALGFNASGALLAAGRSDGSVTVWEVETGSLLHQLQNGGTGCMGMAFHPELDQIAASGEGNIIRIWNAWSGQVLTELSLPNPPGACELSSLAFRSDGQMLAAAMFWENSIALWESNSFVGVLTHPNAGTIWKISWSPDGKLLAAVENAGPQGQQLVLWDVENLSVIAVLEQWREVATFSPDGALLVTYRWDEMTGMLRILAIPLK